MEQDNYVWSGCDNRCAVHFLSQPCNKDLTRIAISKLVGVPFSTVKRIMANYEISGDIYEVYILWRGSQSPMRTQGRPDPRSGSRDYRSLLIRTLPIPSASWQRK